MSLNNDKYYYSISTIKKQNITLSKKEYDLIIKKVKAGIKEWLIALKYTESDDNYKNIMIKFLKWLN